MLLSYNILRKVDLPRKGALNTRVTRCLQGLVLLSAVLVSAGCSTVESDMPWAAPQDWEGSPSVPGLSPQGY